MDRNLLRNSLKYNPAHNNLKLAVDLKSFHCPLYWFCTNVTRILRDETLLNGRMVGTDSGFNTSESLSGKIRVDDYRNRALAPERRSRDKR